MNAEIVSIGTEILIGDILNTNAHFLSQNLAKIGISVYHHTSVGDNYDRLKDTLQLSLSRSDIVITTGGLGPTSDDITVQVAADIFNRKVVLHKPSLTKIEDFFKKRGILNVENAKNQAEIVQGAMALPNTNGMAPGSIIEEDNKVLILLPGPPEEMKSMWLTLLSYLQKKSNVVLCSNTIHMAGIGESTAENELKDIIISQTNPTIAPYAKSSGGVSFRITATAKTKDEAINLIYPIKKEIYARLGSHIFGEDDITLEEAIINLLTQKNLTISVAESITGGMVISRLINVSGASKVIVEGIVAYSNSSKINRDLVPKEILQKYGSVSEQTAHHMAQNIAKTSGAHIGISTTGLASITTLDDKNEKHISTNEHNQGLSYFGICINKNVQIIKYNGFGNRHKIRSQATTNLLEHLRKALKTYMQ